MKLTGIDQLWRADITYIRLATEFIYLAVILDAYSRRVIGWALDRSLEDDLAIAALKMAFRRRHPAEGLTHHSDRGVQSKPTRVKVIHRLNATNHAINPRPERLRLHHPRAALFGDPSRETKYCSLYRSISVYRLGSP
jgi:transposase InsO family protein